MEEVKDPKLFAAFEKFAQWLSLPRHFSKFTTEQLEEKGFNPDIIELIQIRFRKDFAEKFFVSVPMLHEWEKCPEMQSRIKQNWKAWAKRLTPGVMGKFYEKLMIEGDASRMSLWMKSIEDEGKEDQKSININVGLENIIRSMKEDKEF